MLQFENVEKKYRKNIVLKHINISIESPGLYILQGVNGSGKSTILKIISKIIYKTGGDITNDLKVSYLPDKFEMPKLIRVDRYLKEIFYIYNVKANIDLILTEYQIPKRKLGSLSKGNHKKVGIIQILNNPADCYVLDEPLDGLDDATKKLFKAKISEKIQEGKIVILSLHSKGIYHDLKPKVFEVKEGDCIEKRKKD